MATDAGSVFSKFCAIASLTISLGVDRLRSRSHDLLVPTVGNTGGSDRLALAILLLPLLKACVVGELIVALLC